MTQGDGRAPRSAQILPGVDGLGYLGAWKLSIAAPGYSDGRCPEVPLMVSTRSRWLRRSCIIPLCAAALTSDVVGASANGCITESDRVRARQLRIAPGVLAPGPLNA